MTSNLEGPSAWTWKERLCGHVYLEGSPVPETCPFCEHLEPFMDEIIADAMARLAVRSMG